MSERRDGRDKNSKRLFNNASNSNNRSATRDNDNRSNRNESNDGNASRDRSSKKQEQNPEVRKAALREKLAEKKGEMKNRNKDGNSNEPNTNRAGSRSSKHGESSRMEKDGSSNRDRDRDNKDRHKSHSNSKSGNKKSGDAWGAVADDAAAEKKDREQKEKAKKQEEKNEKLREERAAQKLKDEEEAKKKAETEKKKNEHDLKRKAVIEKSLDAAKRMVDEYRKKVDDFENALKKMTLEDKEATEKIKIEDYEKKIKAISEVHDSEEWKTRMSKVQKNAEATKTFKGYTSNKKTEFEASWKQIGQRWDRIKSKDWPRKVEDINKAKKGVYGNFKGLGLSDLESYFLKDDGVGRNDAGKEETKAKEKKEVIVKRLLNKSFKFIKEQLTSSGLYFGEDLHEFQVILKKRKIDSEKQPYKSKRRNLENLDENAENLDGNDPAESDDGFGEPFANKMLSKSGPNNL